MKTKTILAGCMALAGVHMLHAQNASEYNNNASVSGINSSAFGVKALINNGSSDINNTALGFQALFANNGGNDNTASGADALYNNQTGSYNTANGRHSLFNNISGIDNTAAGHSALFSNTIGNFNTAFGKAALYFNDADFNSAFGDSALYNNTSGTNNSAFGSGTLRNNTTGFSNSAYGVNALSNNTSGTFNTAIGETALNQNTTGSNNVAVGYGCLLFSTTGSANTASGWNALSNNTTGGNNTASGFTALNDNTTGILNTAIGSYALSVNISGFGNTSIGGNAVNGNTTGNNNTGIGRESLIANSTGSRNTALGYQSNVSTGNLTNATSLGSNAIVNANNKVRIGSAAVTIVEGPVAYTISDGRFKTNVKNDDVKGLEFIKKLRPVVYNFNTKKFTEFLTKEMTAEQRKDYMNEDFKPSTDIRQSGFIAQEVEQAAKETGYDFNGVHKPVNDNDNYSLAYSQFVVPLVKAVQEQQAMIETQNSEIAGLKKEVAELRSSQNASANQQATGLGNGQAIANTDGFSMAQNVPNPFTHETVIKYNLPAAISNAYMAVYDLSGKQVATFPLAQKGNGSLTITSEKLAPGIYIYSIVGNGSILDSRRMVVADK